MIPELLFREIQKKRCLLFIGAGFSLNAELSNGNKMPTWKEFAEKLSTDFEEEKNDPLEVATHYEKVFGRSNLIKKITEILHVQDAKPGKVHKKLAEINVFDTIVTTNYEFLLEQSYYTEGKQVNVIVGDKNISIYSPCIDTNIIKIHGDLRDHPELVITQEDYDKFLDRHPVLATNLASWFTTRMPIFIGYSLKDPHFLQIRELLKRMLGKLLNNWFVIKHDATDEEIEEARKDGITIISLSTDGKTREESLLEFLSQIQDYIDAKNIDKLDFPSKEEIDSTSTKIPKTNLAENILVVFSDLEVKLRNTLEKFGYEEKDLRKSFSFILKSALTAGILTTADLGELSKISKIRNDIAHTSFTPTVKETNYIETFTKEIIKKLSKIKISSIQTTQIELFSDKFSYESNEVIHLKGKISNIISDTPLTLLIKSSDIIVGLAQVYPSLKGEFEHTWMAGGPLWDISGEYTITAAYGRESKKISINYKKIDTIELSSQFELEVNGVEFPISYLVQGGTMIGFIATIGTNVLTIQIETFTDGKLWIKIPRPYLDAKKGSDDDQFLVLCDGEEVKIIEKSDPNERELIIPFLKGTHEVMIVGTSIIGGEKLKKDSNTVEILMGSGMPRDDEKYLKPQSMIIKKGQTVTWDNCDSSVHTITSGTIEGGHDNIFDSGVFMSGEKFSHKFEKKGTYRYFCLLHPWKEGKIIVTD